MITTDQEVDLCGVGAVTGYGWGLDALWSGLVSGVSACRPVTGVSDDASAWAARIPEGGDPTDGPTRFARSLRASIREAVADARSRGWTPGERVGLIHAAVLGEVDLWRSFYLEHGGTLRVRDFLSLMPSTPVSLSMREHDFHGPAMSVGAMCTSGNAALITAKSWLDAGVVDDVVVVTTDLSCSPEMLTHFRRLGVAVTDQEPLQACRPFQEGSRGFVMGEASIAFVLTGPGRRPVDPYLQVLGGAMTHDAHHVTSIDPDLTAVRRCFELALQASGVSAGDVHYVNAHGPGTRQCDTAEAAIVEQMLSSDTRIYSLKPLLGHCQGASAAAEIAVAALAGHQGLLPLPPQVAPAHPQLLTGLTPLTTGLTAKSALGMGGHNSVILLGQPSVVAA